MEILKYILKEFDLRSTKGKWPGWYRGVSSMYAIEIGVNFALADGICEKNGKFLDHSSTNGKVSETAHIHCWHTFDMFSKFEFLNGKYEQHKRVKIKNSERINFYCLKIALGQFSRGGEIVDSKEYAQMLFEDF
ncbi:hypothetical protein MHBO_004063 [Bonamia ostreae]|uniref:DUF7164 domain-containing protein n=1 Tax=Bonamia ostreae TaxID=126728 RepID=A0ABV2AS97_9EUKA